MQEQEEIRLFRRFIRSNEKFLFPLTCESFRARKLGGSSTGECKKIQCTSGKFQDIQGRVENSAYVEWLSNPKKRKVETFPQASTKCGAEISWLPPRKEVTQQPCGLKRIIYSIRGHSFRLPLQQLTQPSVSITQQLFFSWKLLSADGQSPMYQILYHGLLRIPQN